MLFWNDINDVMSFKIINKRYGIKVVKQAYSNNEWSEKGVLLWPQWNTQNIQAILYLTIIIFLLTERCGGKLRVFCKLVCFF